MADAEAKYIFKIRYFSSNCGSWVKGSGLFEKAPDIISAPGLIVLAGVAIMILAVILASPAGFECFNAPRDTGVIDPIREGIVVCRTGHAGTANNQ